MRGITMRGRGFEGMRTEELELLEEIRRQAIERRELEEQKIRLSVYYRSPAMSVMPRGGNKNEAAERRIDARDAIEKRIAVLDEQIAQMAKTLAPSIEGLPTHLFAIVNHYFLCGLSVNETCKVIERSRKTFFRHRRELENWSSAKMTPK